jgi:hypothetical protein
MVVACGGNAGVSSTANDRHDAATTGADGSDTSVDGSSGSLDGGAAPADGGTYILTSLNEPCDGGPTGLELLSYFEPTYAGAYVPPSGRPSSAPWRGTLDAGVLTIAPSYDGGRIECTPAPPFTCCTGCPCRTPPPPTVSLDFNVTLRTADGTFRETFPATGTYSPDINEVQWAATVDKANVAGTYPFSPGSTRLVFSGSFGAVGAPGTIVESEPPLPDGGSASLTGGSWSAAPVDAGPD